MADGKVTVELSVQDAQALAAWQRGKKGIEQMQQEMGGLKRETGRSAKAGNDMVTGLVGGFARMAAGALTVGKALSFAKSEYEAMLARQKAAAGFQVSASSSQRAALRNLSGSELTPKQLDEHLKAVQAQTGADLTSLYSSASDVLSARGSISEAEALGQVGAVAKMDASMAPDEMSKIAGAALDIRKAFGGGAEQAVGALLTAQQTARVTQTRDFATSAVPALFAMSTRGDTFREASALYSTISQQSADVTGERSGTAMIRFSQQLVQATAAIDELKTASVTARMNFLLSGDKRGEEIRRTLVGNLNRDFEGSTALAEQEYDPTQRAKLTGEAKQFFTMIELLQRGSPTRKAYEANLAATPEYEQAAQRFNQNLRAQADLGLQATARVSEIGRGALQTAQQDELAGKTGQVKQDLDALLEQVGTFGRPAAHYVGGETGPASPFMFRSQLAAGGTGAPETVLIEAARVAEARLAVAEATGEAAAPENAQKVAALKGYAARLRSEAKLESSRRLRETIADIRKQDAELPKMSEETLSLAAIIRAQKAEKLGGSGGAARTRPAPGQRPARKADAQDSDSPLILAADLLPKLEPAQPSAPTPRFSAEIPTPRLEPILEDSNSLARRQTELLEQLVRNTANERPTPAHQDHSRRHRLASSRPPVIGGN